MRTTSRARSAVAVAVLAVGAIALALGVRVSGGRPSLLVVTVDTLRADHVGAYGGTAARTPNLDRLAAEGALFLDAATPCPVTLPAHASLLTGLTPPRHGLRLNDPPRALPPPAGRDFRTLAEVLREQGYATGAFISASPLARRWGLDAGFDVYEGPDANDPGSPTLAEVDGSVTVGRALGFLRTRNRRRPCFLWVHLFDPHAPYAAPGGSGAPPDSREAYAEEVTYADAQIGRLLDALRADGTLDATVVVATADHGEGLGEHGESTHGYFLYRSTLRVPLLVRYPRRVPPGTRVTEPVGLIDVFPTALRLLGIRSDPARLDGRALLPAPAAPPGPAAAPVHYAESLYAWRSFRWAQCCATRVGPLRTIDYGGGRREVYDLEADPGERSDLAATRGGEVAEAAHLARTLLRSKPWIAVAAATAGAPPEPSAIGYMAGGSAIEVADEESERQLPLPSATLVAAFERAIALFAQAQREEVAAIAFPILKEARESLLAIGKVDPANPAIPFWVGRTLAHQGKVAGTGARAMWAEAFFEYQKAGAVYRDANTVCLMLQAAHEAGQPKDMLRAATLAREAGIDGGSPYWCWIALAEIEGADRGPDGVIPAAARAAAEAALARAAARSRGPADDRHIAEIRGLIR